MKLIYTILFHNMQAADASTLVDHESSEPEDKLEPHVIPKPSPEKQNAERRSPSSKSARVVMTRRSATQQLKKREDLEVSDYLTSSSKVFKSVDAYNKLLETRVREERERRSTLSQKKDGEKQRKLERQRDRFRRLKGLGGFTSEEAEQGPKDFVTSITISKKQARS